MNLPSRNGAHIIWAADYELMRLAVHVYDGYGTRHICSEISDSGRVTGVDCIFDEKLFRKLVKTILKAVEESAKEDCSRYAINECPCILDEYEN